jgi:hypothetical protein
MSDNPCGQPLNSIEKYADSKHSAINTGLQNSHMNQFAHNKLVSFIWSIADDCLRDVYVRGKYRDVILPMVVLRRLDTLLEPTNPTSTANRLSDCFY